MSPSRVGRDGRTPSRRRSGSRSARRRASGCLGRSIDVFVRSVVSSNPYVRKFCNGNATWNGRTCRIRTRRETDAAEPPGLKTGRHTRKLPAPSFRLPDANDDPRLRSLARPYDRGGHTTSLRSRLPASSFPLRLLLPPSARRTPGGTAIPDGWAGINACNAWSSHARKHLEFRMAQDWQW